MVNMVLWALGAGFVAGAAWARVLLLARGEPAGVLLLTPGGPAGLLLLTRGGRLVERAEDPLGHAGLLLAVQRKVC
jgi:hypothetical protein